MRTKKFFVIVLALVTALTLGLFAACGEKEEKPTGATQLTIDSKTEDTIEVGQSYTLQYTCKGTVTVTVSGGTYDEVSCKFTADAVGEYTLTVTGEEAGKTPTVKEVKITVVAGADKTQLKKALDDADAKGLVATDYTNWAAYTTARRSAQSVLEEAGYTQAEVDAEVKAFNRALQALTPAGIEKATVGTDSFTYNQKVYSAADYKNISDLITEITSLNNDASVNLRSVYQQRIAAILDKLQAKLSLALSGGLVQGGSMLVSALRSYHLTAQSEDGATYQWKVGEVNKAQTAEFDFTPEAYNTPYTISCTATKGGESNTKSFTVTFEQAVYQNNAGEGISVENDVVTVTKSFDWGAILGKKVSLSDLYLTGDFSVTFDVTFTKHEGDAGNANVMALFLLDADGNQRGIWVAVCEQNGWLEVTTKDEEAAKIRKTMPQGAWDLDKTMHIRVTRTAQGDAAVLTADLLDDSGNVLFHNDGVDASGTLRTIANDAVMLGIQAEHASFKVENLAVSCEGIVNLVGLRAAVNENTGKYLEEDYTQNTYGNFTTALTAANAILNKKSTASATEIAGAITLIKRATEALKLAEVAKATVAEDSTSFAYAGKTYKEENYENFEAVLAKVTALNAREDITKNSQYKQEILTVIDELVPYVSVSISGIEERIYLVATLPKYVTLTATAIEGATFKWEVNGEEKGTVAQLQFQPEFKNYTVKCTVSYGGRTAEKEIEFGYKKATYQNNFANDIAVEDNVVKVNNSLEWGNNEGRKVVLNDVYLNGNFTVYFDLKFTQHEGDVGNANVMALFLLNAEGNSEVNWVAVCQQNNRLETAFGGDGWQKPQLNMPGDLKNEDGTTKLNTVLHFSVTREIEGGKAYLIARLLSDDGEVLLEHKGIRQEGGTERLSKDYTGNVLLGIQAEHVRFEVSNISVDNDAAIVDLPGLRSAIASAETIHDAEEDYTEATYTKFSESLTKARAALADSRNVTASAVEKAIKDLTEAQAELVFDGITKTVPTADSITYGETTYQKSEGYLNFNEIVAEIEQLNGRADIERKSDYRKALEEILSRLAKEFTLTGEEGNQILNTLEGFNFTYKATQLQGYTYKWDIDGAAAQETGYTCTLPSAYGEHTVKVTATKGEQSYTAEKKLTLMQANFVPHSDDANKTKVEGNTFTTQTGIGWNDWLGRNLILDDLVFNGSFSLMADITWNEQPGGANVVTFHLINADTMSYDYAKDNATFATWGCICLHENPKRLELTLRNNKAQMNLDQTVSDHITVGSTFTVKFTVLRKDRSCWLKYAVQDPVTGNWSEYERPDTNVGDFDNGFYVGINIENTGVSISNFRYETISDGDHANGSVASKVALHNELKATEEIYKNFTQYEDGMTFRSLWESAYAVYTMNGDGAESYYDGAAQSLREAKAGIAEQKRAIKVHIPMLEEGMTKLCGVTSLTATFEEAEATDISWSWGQQQTQQGATLNLQTGTYENLTLHFKVGGQQYDYTYFTVVVEELSLKSNTDKVAIEQETNKVTVTDGAGWGGKDQLVIEKVHPTGFELTFNVKYTEHGGDYRVFCINLFGEDVRPVFGYQRENIADRMQYGFDNLGNGSMNNLPKSEHEADYNYLHDQSAKFSLKMSPRDVNGCFNVTFSAYRADGSAIFTCSYTYFLHFDTNGTDLRFTFENVNLEITNIQLAYTTPSGLGM